MDSQNTWWTSRRSGSLHVYGEQPEHTSYCDSSVLVMAQDYGVEPGSIQFRTAFKIAHKNSPKSPATMSRDYSETRDRSRSRSPRGRDYRNQEVRIHDMLHRSLVPQTSHQTYEERQVRDSDLAAEFGYSAPSWEKSGNSSSHHSSTPPSSSWGGSVSIPAPPNEAEQWGYAAKPYVPPAMPMSMPLLSNPMVQPPPPPPMPAAPLQGAHVVIESVPMELNMMSLLYEHFKQFGDVVSIHCIQKHGKALIDFKSRQIADAAVAQPVLGVPSIKAVAYNGPARGPGSARNQGMRPALAPSMPTPPSSSVTAAAPLTKNLVFESEAARRAREKREKNSEIDKKRIDLLNTCTAHVQQIVAKLVDKSLPEETRAKYQKMLETVKGKISELQKEETERRKKESEAMNKALSLRYKAYEKQARIDSSIKQQQLTLDLRSRCVRISGLPEELAQSVVLVEYLRAMGMKDLDEVIWLDDRTAAVLRFKSHAAAECLIKHELAFTAEWVSNEAAQNLANFNPVEQVEIAEGEDDDGLVDDIAANTV